MSSFAPLAPHVFLAVLALLALALPAAASAATHRAGAVVFSQTRTVEGSKKAASSPSATATRTS